MALGASIRRVVGGLNLLLNIALIGALAFLLMWAAGRFAGEVDVTRSGVNSLSPRTRQLVAGLEQNVRLTSVYSTVAKDIRKYAEKHANRVWDLLRLYDNAGGARVDVFRIDPKEDAKEIQALLERLKNEPAIAAQLAPYQEALRGFGAVSAEAAQFMQSETATLQALAQTDTALAQARELAMIERNATTLVQEAQQVEEQLERLQTEEAPDYGMMRSAVTGYLGEVSRILESHRNWMSGPGAQLAGLSADARAFMSGAADRYQLVLEKVSAALDELNGLEPLEFDNIVEQLRSGQCVVLEVGDKVQAVGHDEIWPFQFNRNLPPAPDGDTRQFAGEQAISSALLKLTQTERTAVVFVRFGGQPLLTPDFSNMNPMRPMPEAAFEQLSTALEGENFIVREWDVQTQPTPPEIEDAARTAYVVFAPEPPQQPQFQQPQMPQTLNPQQKQAVLDAVRASGMSMFLVSWSGPASPMAPAPPYPYADYLRDSWGVGVDPGYLAFSFMPSPQDPDLYVPKSQQGVLGGEDLAYGAHPIAVAIAGLTAGLPGATPLETVSPPEGVTLTPILLAPDSQDVWAFSNVNRVREDFDRRQGTRQYEDDRDSPFPLAVAGTRAAAGEGGAAERIVVFGSEQFASNSTLNAGGLMLVGGQLVLAQAYPANRDLFINALHWLTGDAARIAVGPSQGDVPRLSKLKDEELFSLGSYPVSTVDFLRIFLVAIWPGLALLSGAFVWFMRRR